jgi:asparagine synthase (glutamine-hydrolysing)
VLHTHCDTEILPHLFQEFGDAVPEHIDGMFAVAIWDDERRRGLLARDRLGKKPLYYCASGDQLYFASELKALLAIPGFHRELNLEALSHYLSLKHVPHPHTIFKGVAILPPAHRLIFEPGAPVRVERYWDVSFAPDPAVSDLSDEAATAEVRRLLQQGVERRLMSDVPIGFFLSGGLDSSLSTALAAEAASGPIKTFTLTYGEDSTTPGKEEDRRWARWVAERYGTDHHEEQVAFTGFPESIRKILRCFDEPFAGVVSSYFLSQLIAQHVKVALSGDGADELFGSYRTHRLAAEPGATVDGAWRSQFVVFTDAEKRELFHPDVAAALEHSSTAGLFEDAFARLTATDPLNQVLEAELRTVFPDQVLTYGDRLSMAHSLEVRSAYLDTELVEFAARLPARLKIRDGETKYVLKRVAREYFPAAMVDRPKEGFLMPVTQWFQRDLETYVRATLAPDRLALHSLFRQEGVDALVNRLYQPGSDYHDVNRVMSVVIFQEWYELYLA